MQSADVFDNETKPCETFQCAIYHSIPVPECLLSVVQTRLDAKKLDCKTPWLFDELAKGLRECNETEYQSVFDTVNSVFIDNLRLNVSECPQLCEEVQYQTKIRFYEILNGVQFYEPMDEVNGHQKVYFYFGTNNATLQQYIPTLTLWGLISACGGSLGLFLGFSFYNLVSSLLRYAKKPSTKKGSKGSKVITVQNLVD